MTPAAAVSPAAAAASPAAAANPAAANPRVERPSSSRHPLRKSTLVPLLKPISRWTSSRADPDVDWMYNQSPTKFATDTDYPAWSRSLRFLPFSIRNLFLLFQFPTWEIIWCAEASALTLSSRFFIPEKIGMPYNSWVVLAVNDVVLIIYMIVHHPLWMCTQNMAAMYCSIQHLRWRHPFWKVYF